MATAALAGSTIPAHYGADASGTESWTEQGYDLLVNRWCDQLFEEARADKEMNIENDKFSTYIDYLMGKQWPGNRPKYKSTPVNNRTWRLFQELLALLTDIRPNWEVKATRKEYDQQGTIINKASRAWWLESDSDQRLAMVIIYAMLSTGFAKLQWNPMLRNGEGDFELLPLANNQCFPIKAKFSIHDGQGVIYRTPMPVGWFRNKFGARGAMVQPDGLLSRFEVRTKNTPSHMTQLQFGALAPQMQNLMSKGPSFQQSGIPMAMYEEFWVQDYSYNTSLNDVQMGPAKANWGYVVKPGQRLYPRGRLICRGGNVIVSDGPNPYWHGKFPFLDLRMNIVPWQYDGISDLRNMLPLQDIINNILAGVLDMIKKTLNPPLIGPKAAFSDSIWNTLDLGMPGARYGYSQLGGGAPAPVQPGQIPGYVLAILQLAAREMDQASSIAAVNEALGKRQVPSGDTLERIRDTQNTPIRLKGRNIEVFMRHVGSMTVSNIFQFYTAKRRFFMFGNEGLTTEDFDWDPGTMIPNGTDAQAHIRNFVFMVNPGSLLNANRVEKATLMLNLRKSKDIDRRTLYEQLDMNINIDEVEKRLTAEQAHDLAAIMAAKSAQAPPPGGGQ